MSEEQPLESRILEALRSGSAPDKVKIAAARGALPLTPFALAEMQVLLCQDKDPMVQQAATESLRTLDAGAALQIATEEDASRELLHLIAGWSGQWAEAGAAVARRSDASPETLRMLAAQADELVLEALILNQVALLEDPELRGILLDNASLGTTLRFRLLDYIEEIDKESARKLPNTTDDTPEPLDAATEVDHAAKGPPPAIDPFLASLGIDAEVEAMLPELGIDIEQLSERSELLGDDLEDADEGLIKRISQMNVGQKLRVALFGSKEERTILVRDSNRIVASAVVKNPKFTDSEAEAVSKSRNVSEDVLRLIARHRDFAKQYSIQHCLVLNPRTPFDISKGFILFLNDRDLGLVSKSRSVADVVRRHAKKTLSVRQARRQGRKVGR